MFMFELMGDSCPCGGDCSRYWHEEGLAWGAELTDADWDFELPEGIELSTWGESGCTWGLALDIAEADWSLVLGTSLSDGEVRDILQSLRRTSREEMLQWTVEYRSGCAMGPFGMNCGR